MCKLAQQDEKVKNVITNNGHITCFLKEMRGERNTTCRLEKPEDPQKKITFFRCIYSLFYHHTFNFSLFSDFTQIHQFIITTQN